MITMTRHLSYYNPSPPMIRTYKPAYLNITTKNLKNLQHVVQKYNYITYIIHYTPLVERKKHIINEMKTNNIDNYKFIEEYDKEILTKNELMLFDETKVRPAEISLTMKHITSWKHVIQSNNNFALIFEDDVLLQNNFSHKLNNYISQLPKTFDMCFIGECARLHINKNIIKNAKPGTNIFKKTNYPTWWGGNGATRCTDSYLISKDCCNKIINYINKLKQKNIKINMPLDFWMNNICRELSLNIYWAEPTIIKQGTETGLFKSAIK